MAVCNWLNFLWLGSLCYNKVCYDDLGCFENKPPFNNANSELPDSPDDIKVSFLLYTVNNLDIHQSITTNASQIKTTEYQGSRRTVFLIHGYLGGPEDKWILDAKNAILKKIMQVNSVSSRCVKPEDCSMLFVKEDANIVVVDWENGADDLGNYFQAAANTRIVGALTAHLMTSLFTSAGAKYEDMYIVGYSLGAHVAGYAGEKVPDLGRITGLDPAYSAFSEDEPAVRLDTTDATFVDIIHTDGKQWFWGFGIPDSIGHADFFPNGGFDQPGCESWFFLKQSTCDHGRATEYFVESINSACSFEAVPCMSWRKFRREQCSCETDCSRMGFTEEQAGVSGKYYLETNSQSPFCKI